MFFLLGEPGYITSNWYKHILDGIFAEKRSKRFNVIVIDSIDETEKFSLNSDDAILLIGSSLKWLESIIDVCEEKFSKNVIVLGNFERQLNGRSYSIVSSDISADVYNLYGYLASYKKNKIAMYGINPKSASDTYRKNSFLECGGSINDIYTNNANLKECYESIAPVIHQYDAVLCANDYAAISLIRFMQKDNIKVPFISSCGETKLAKIFNPSITNLRTSYKDFGKAAISVYKMLQKDYPVSSIRIKLASCIIPGASTDNLPVQKTPALTVTSGKTTTDDTFYSDSEVAEMLGIESILSRSDKTELDMLFSLINGLTYFDIAEKYNMSVNGVKYKLNKLFELCHVSSKAEFLECIKKYLV